MNSFAMSRTDARNKTREPTDPGPRRCRPWYGPKTEWRWPKSRESFRRVPKLALGHATRRFNNANRAVAARCTVCSPHETYHTMNSFAMSRTDARNITKEPTDPGPRRSRPLYGSKTARRWPKSRESSRRVPGRLNNAKRLATYPS